MRSHFMLRLAVALAAAALFVMAGKPSATAGAPGAVAAAGEPSKP